jgi:hypothetical protein
MDAMHQYLAYLIVRNHKDDARHEAVRPPRSRRSDRRNRPTTRREESPQ